MCRKCFPTYFIVFRSRISFDHALFLLSVSVKHFKLPTQMMKMETEFQTILIMTMMEMVFLIILTMMMMEMVFRMTKKVLF